MHIMIRRAVAVMAIAIPALLITGVLFAQGPKKFINLCFEAEDALKTEGTVFMVKKRTEDAVGKVSGNKVLEIPKAAPGQKVPRNDVIYRVKIPETGVYYLWARTYWTTGCGNSFFLKVEGYESGEWILGGDATYDVLHWIPLKDGSNPRPLMLKKGIVTFTLGSREGGVRADQFLLTTDQKKVPQNDQKITKDCLAPEEVKKKK